MLYGQGPVEFKYANPSEDPAQREDADDAVAARVTDTPGAGSPAQLDLVPGLFAMVAAVPPVRAAFRDGAAAGGVGAFGGVGHRVPPRLDSAST